MYISLVHEIGSLSKECQVSQCLHAQKLCGHVNIILVTLKLRVGYYNKMIIKDMTSPWINKPSYTNNSWTSVAGCVSKENAAVPAAYAKS